MRITAKGQVTIPVRIREEARLRPGMNVEVAYRGDGEVVLFRADKSAMRKRLKRALSALERLAGKGDIPPTTDEIMAMTRGDPD